MPPENKLCEQCLSEQKGPGEALKGFCTCPEGEVTKVCTECKSDSFYDSGDVILVLHENTCSKYKGSIRNFKRSVEDREIKINTAQRQKENRMPTEEEKVKEENRQLRRKFDGLMEVVSNSLITIDWVFKLGLPLGLFFFPLVQDRWYQSIGVFGYVLLLTLISKAIIKVKSYRLDD